MPTAPIIRTALACRAMVGCLNAGASLNQIAKASGVSAVAVKGAIEAGRRENAPADLRDLAAAYDRQQERQAEATRRIENECAILRKAVKGA